MAREETRVFNGEGKEISAVVESVQETLKELNQTTKIMQLDKSLVEVQGEAAKGDPIGKIIVTVYKEYSQYFIKIKHSMDNPDRFWIPFQENMALYAASDEEVGEKAKVVQKIIDNINILGGQVAEEQTWDFLFNFEKQYGHLPNEEEVKNIALSYVDMLDKQEISEVNLADLATKPEVALKTEPEVVEEKEKEPEPGEVTPEDALKAMIDDMATLMPQEKRKYKDLFEELTLEQQKILVKKLIDVDGDMDKIPYITPEERAEYRDDLLATPREKRIAKVAKILAKRKKKTAVFQSKELDMRLKEQLADLPNLSDLEKDIYITSTQVMNPEEKVKFIEKLKQVETLLDSFAAGGFLISEMERKHYRDDLLRMEDDKMQEYLDDLKSEKLKKLTSEELFAEIPQLAFENYDKYVKELMWLSAEERKEKIAEFKLKLSGKLTEKQKAFQEAKSVSACPACGWPVGSFSKKCPRCGKNLTGW